MYGDYLTLVNKTKKKVYFLGKIVRAKHDFTFSHRCLTPYGDIDSSKEFLDLLSYILVLNKDDDIILVEDDEIEEGGKYAEFINYDDSGVDFEWYFSVMNNKK